MSGQHLTIAALVDEYALYGVTRGMIRAHATSIAVNAAVHIDDDYAPLPTAVARELVAELDAVADDFQAQIPARQAAYAEVLRRNGGIVA